MQSIRIIYRNYGHWDFYRETGGRLFRLRGSGDSWLAMNAQGHPYPVNEFKTFTLALAFITESLMHENLIPDGLGNNKPQ